MTISAHVAIGSAIGLATGNPVAGFFLGVISHHVADSIPHVDPGTFGVGVNTILKNDSALIAIAFDVLIAFIIFLIFLFKTNFSLAVFFGAFGGIFTDLVDNVPFWTPKLRKIFPFSAYHKVHEFFHATIIDKKYIWIGITTQIVIITAAFIFLFHPPVSS